MLMHVNSRVRIHALETCSPGMRPMGFTRETVNVAINRVTSDTHEFRPVEQSTCVNTRISLRCRVPGTRYDIPVLAAGLSGTKFYVLRTYSDDNVQCGLQYT